jgi:RNA polymerase sigma-70 factor (ECF subfamily)
MGSGAGCALTKGSQDACVESQALAGRPEAASPSFTDVFQAHAGYVLGLLGRLGVAAADLEDVAQDVFIAIHQKLPGFEGRSTLKTWVCGICLRRASDYRRRAHRRRELLVPDFVERAAGEQPEGAALRREHARLLQQALAVLPEPQMQVFVLYELEELPMAEVAQAVGCPRFTAYTRLRAARRLLREWLQRRESGRSR